MPVVLMAGMPSGDCLSSCVICQHSDLHKQGHQGARIYSISSSVLWPEQKLGYSRQGLFWNHACPTWGQRSVAYLCLSVGQVVQGPASPVF